MRTRCARSLGPEALTMIDRIPELLVQDEDGASQRAKFSQLMLEFAEPLLAIARAEGPSIEALRRSMMLATLCWNAPLRAVQGDDRAQRELDVFLKSAEPALRAALRSMLSSRMTQYAGVPFAVFANVEGSSAENARCVAYATATPEQLAALEGTRPAPIPLTPTGGARSAASAERSVRRGAGAVRSGDQLGSRIPRAPDRALRGVEGDRG
jgi:hypothetical protein